MWGFGTPGGYGFNPYYNPGASAWGRGYGGQFGYGYGPGYGGFQGAPQQQGQQQQGGNLTNTQSGTSPSAAGDQVSISIKAPTTAFGAPGPTAESSQASGPDREFMDPFGQTEIGKLLRQLSMDYARSPFAGASMWPNMMQAVPGSWQHPPTNINIGGMPGMPGQQGQAQQPGGERFEPEILHRFGPLEAGIRMAMNRRLLGSAPYINKIGPGRSLSYHGHSNRRQGATRTTHTPAMFPELWDPYRGLYQWRGGMWSPLHGGY